jgi:DNA-binding NtrC family response regulator
MFDTKQIPPIQQRSVEELIDRNLLDHKRGIDEIMDRFRNTIVVRALTLCDGNQTEACRILKTHRSNLERWMREAGLSGRTNV